MIDDFIKKVEAKKNGFIDEIEMLRGQMFEAYYFGIVDLGTELEKRFTHELETAQPDTKKGLEKALEILNEYGA